jgi:hypothetical protein
MMYYLQRSKILEKPSSCITYAHISFNIKNGVVTDISYITHLLKGDDRLSTEYFLERAI